MKLLVSFLLLCAAAFSQTANSPKIVTFDRADSGRCRVVVVDGKPLLETTYNGTKVAVSVPQNWANGEFSVYISVAQVGAGEAQINPREISALYSDPAHTRLRWFDKGRDLDTEASARAAGLGPVGNTPPVPGSMSDSSSAAPPPNHPEAMRSSDGIAPTRSEEEARQLQLRNEYGNGSRRPQLDPAHPPIMLKHIVVKEGSRAAGYVFIRKAKGAKVEITASGMLDEIDIPINGVVFRF